MASTNDYLALITSEHAQQPLFTQAIQALTAGLIDGNNVIQSITELYDLDTAVSAQLDAVGLWVGVTRQVPVPIPNVYFSFDTTGLGFDQGTWLGPGDPTSGVVNLADDAFRLLIRARIGANHWDGTPPSLAAILTQIFTGTGVITGVNDHQDMTMTIGVAGTLISAINLALLTGGSLVPKPFGVKMNYVVTSVPGTPLFGFDVQNSYISGFDTGAFGTSF